MTYFKLVSLDNKLATIPIRGSWLKSEPIGGKGDGKHYPSTHIVDQLIFSCNHSVN